MENTKSGTKSIKYMYTYTNKTLAPPGLVRRWGPGRRGSRQLSVVTAPLVIHNNGVCCNLVVRGRGWGVMVV